MSIDFSSGMNAFAGTLPEGSGFSAEQDRILALAADLDRARSEGLFVPLPVSPPRVWNDASRIRTIRDRLYRLGYIGKPTGDGACVDEVLRQGLKAFQAEAGLTVDGWAGEKETWPALQELVSFESPISVGNWFDGHGPRPALRRAIALRLFVLGIRQTRPSSADVPIQGDLRRFASIWNTLELGPPAEQLPAGIDPGWVRRLFDMDGLSRRLAQVQKTPDSTAQGEVRRFVLNAAKVELWLHGYKVSPDGRDLKVSRKSKPFYDALQRFWTDRGLRDAEADTRSVCFFQGFQSFFKAVDEHAGQTWTPEEAQAQVVRFVEERQAELPTIWDRVRTLGASVWDGIRRVWGWFRNMVRRGARRVLAVGRNMSRLVYDYALGAFSIASNVMRSIGATVRMLADPVLPGSCASAVLFLKDASGDPRVVVNSGADGKLVEQCCGTLVHEARKFSFGCLVIGTLVRILATVFTRGWTGYCGLVLALVKLRGLRIRYRSLAAAYRLAFGTPD